ncbi:hypothetical protein CCAX7_56250 [Capsulimonas corticalis]|uniref:Uncharacterized protein n=1 Tax=Capsulimonas corticalis TaxID=2219043 RepID=A0A402D0R5_9BACT|nr:VOC family protein [Capsulimonas corticalis]BDI33574.1 hypothetical protein CCAX7_56250 [Capsulimonas corticalis]
MKVNHLDLQVSDIHAARTFFETHFGLRCTYTRGDEIALLDDEIGFSLGVSNLGNHPAPVYPPDFHLGFVLEKSEELQAMYTRFQADGVPIKRELQQGGPNLYFVCEGPSGIPVEVRAPLRTAP